MSGSDSFSQFPTFSELEPEVGRLLERHLGATKEWFPHELVPYSRGRDFVAGEAWTESDSFIPLDEAVRSSLFVNLLTEDNLPYYSRDIDACSVATAAGANGPADGQPRRAGTPSSSATT